MAVQIGRQAPDFTLPDEKAQPFTLSEQQGRNVLLLFFPGAFTSTCTEELCSVSNAWGDFGGDDAVVVGISTDSIPVLNKFKREEGIRFPLLSDHSAEVCARYGAKYNHDFTPLKLDRIARRAAFVIDGEGVVRYAEVLDDADDLPDFDAIKEVLASVEA